MTMTRAIKTGHDASDSVAPDAWSPHSAPRPNRTPLETPKRLRNDRRPQEVDVSPHTIVTPSSTDRSNIAPWETPAPSELSKVSKPPVMQASPNIPSTFTNENNPPALRDPTAQYGRHNRPTHFPSSIFGASYYDSNDDMPQLSPGFQPPNGQEYLSADRRPSVASTTTMSSTGSKLSIGAIHGRFHKKLQGFFGDEYDNKESDGASTTTPTGDDDASAMDRQGSVISVMAASPGQSRPRTPQPSSEITPWAFQDSDDVPKPPPAEIIPAESTNGRSSKPAHHHRLHLPGHRHHRSNDEPPRKASATPSEQTIPRPTTSRDTTNTHTSQLRDAQSSVSSGATLRPRATSPTPSMGSAHSLQSTPRKSPAPSTSTKRSIFKRVTGRHKHDKGSPDTSTRTDPSHTSSISLASSSRAATLDEEIAPFNQKQRKGTIADVKSLVHAHTISSGKKEHSRIPFKGARRADPSAEYKQAKDPNAARAPNNSALWHLDTDMSKMEGIIDHRGPMMTPPVGKGDSLEAFPWDGNPSQQPPGPIDDAGAWDAPDSWAVKRIADDNVARLGEVDADGELPKDEEAGSMYFMRVFRADSTFAVISAGINTTSAELIQMMAKKTFLQDELDTYHLVMKKRGLSRQLGSGERPLFMQTKLLEAAGYHNHDRLEDLGREDHGYLCRFTFLPSKMSGYSSLEKDPGFSKMQKFNHIDLAGRNLVTIPIVLYQKAAEIITLNLSQNLSLDIPKDFMQSCVNLREIKFTGNEAWKLPQSFQMAQKLTMVDFSNNRLESLDHTQHERLSGLISVKLSNNKLQSLPPFFATFQSLRSLNLASNNLTEFPDFLGELASLRDLDISFNAISSVPCIGQLVNLERLFATNNKLSGSFPDNFKDLVNLNSLDVRFNSLDNIDVMSQLPKLEHLMVGHNSISAFEGTFSRLKLLFIDHNPVTRFGLAAPVPTLSVLNIASAKLAELPEDLFMKLSGLTKLVLNKNHLVDLSPQIGRLAKLEHLSVAKNLLGSLPPEIGHLAGLKYLDVRENNLNRLPSEIWFARRLETLNVASNVLADFPKPGNAPPAMIGNSMASPVSTPGVSGSPDFDELGKLEGFQLRRPSHASAGPLMGGATSPGGPLRKASVASALSQTTARNPSLTARSSTESNLGSITPVTRKDSTLSSKLMSTFAQSLRTLILADNRLTDDVFDELMMLPELRMLNLSYNELYDMPSRTIKRWPNLTELYLSGNDLTSLPAEDLEDGSALRILHLNGNKFQVLPAELGKIQKLQTLDVASNSLKYNVSNWPYDWNWNWNHQLRYLNMSGNKRLEIKPSANALSGRGETRDLTDFTALTSLRVLGLMDVTLTIPSVPDEGSDRRVRTAGSMIGTSIPYGMADTLGRHEHLSTVDMVIPGFGGHEDQTVFGVFDGQTLSNGGSRIARYLHEKFRFFFAEELDRLRTNTNETPNDALRRSFLGLNKELASTITSTLESKETPSSALVHRGSVSGPELGEDDLKSGAVGTVLYLHGTELYVANVGDAQALLIQSEGGHRVITRKHDPAEAGERQRIKEAGGFVSRQGKLNDVLEVSRAFGFVHLTPCVIAAPHVAHISLKESDEMILLASRELWEYLTPDFAVDVARSERGDLMRAAQKLRDLAIAFGATSKIMVMMVGVSDLRKRERARFRTHSMSMGPSGTPDDFFTTRRAKRGRDNIGDSKLARLDQEVDAPQGEVSLVFTDIKNSTMLWETYPIAMRSAIKMHNEVMRRHLRIIGGYEVKTEGDAFMVAFPTVTSALLWCFTTQSQLLEVQWPQEILNSINGQEVLDAEDNVIFRGLSVRMGIHWGHPVCEPDPVTKRMDYFGPMVNRAARISSVADGGQITVSSDFIAEIQRLLETHIESDRSGSTGSEDTMSDDMMSQAIRRELRSLSSQGFEVKDLGHRTLKGLENPEYIYLMYPHSLASRLVVQQQRADAQAAAASSQDPSTHKSHDSSLTIDTDNVWDLWNVSLRLEMLCSSFEANETKALKPPETALLERMKERGGEITDRFLLNFVEHQISRIETCITTLTVRNMIRPLGPGMLRDACPMSEILAELAGQLQDLQGYREQADISMAPA